MFIKKFVTVSGRYFSWREQEIFFAQHRQKIFLPAIWRAVVNSVLGYVSVIFFFATLKIIFSEVSFI